MRALEISGARTGTGPGVAAIRELERLSAVGASLQQLRVVVGQFGGLGTLARHVARSLRQHGGAGDHRRRARSVAARRRRQPLRGHRLRRLRAADRRPAPRSPTTPPPASSRRAGAPWPSASPATFDRSRALPAVETHGMRLPVLRETRMTAVVCSLGPVQRIVDAAPARRRRRGRRARRLGGVSPLPQADAVTGQPATDVLTRRGDPQRPRSTAPRSGRLQPRQRQPHTR